MSKKTSYAVTISVPLALTCLFVAVSSCYASVDSYLDGQMKIIESRIGAWETTARVIACLTYVAVAIGIIVAALQPISKKWVKAGAAALAVASALLVAFNHTFYLADDRAYDKVARHARSKLQEYSLQLNQYTVLDPEVKKGLYEKFTKLEQDIDDFETATIYGGTTTAINAPSFRPEAFFVTTARADDQADSARIPEWARQVPTDERNIYFLGVGEGMTFEGARDSALTKARQTASETVAKAASSSQYLAREPQLVEKLAKALADSAPIAETFTVPSSRGGFQSFVLLRVSKSAATFTTQSVFVESSVPYDKSFLDKVKMGFKQ